MRNLKLFIVALAVGFATSINAQTVDEIIDTYFENTGGYDAWRSLKGVKMTAKVNQGGMEIPVEIVQMSDGRSYSKISFQGMNIMQGVFDGTT
ncbi:MAG: outer membrane lipoprotein-sorting protein, partial [Bacteroidia bacterium]|nr:outer membrane lipoprotein-sorting protein [Bacteroidia bacterium]